jgi:hypothetical protein
LPLFAPLLSGFNAGAETQISEVSTAWYLVPVITNPTAVPLFLVWPAGRHQKHAIEHTVVVFLLRIFIFFCEESVWCVSVSPAFFQERVRCAWHSHQKMDDCATIYIKSGFALLLSGSNVAPFSSPLPLLASLDALVAFASELGVSSPLKGLQTMEHSVFLAGDQVKGMHH